MSAEQAREELEYRLWRSGLKAPDVRVILAVADDYANAKGDEEASMFRLAAATAEKFGGTR